MGNQISFRPSDSRGKVVFLDGSVHEFEEQITAAELMMDHPQKVVVEFHSAVSQKRPAPLPADKKLEMNKMYLMLPVKRGKAVGLSGDETRRVLLMVNSVLCSSKFFPWFSSLCHSSEIVEPRRKEEEKEKEKGEIRDFSENFPEILEGRPDYLNRQISGKVWKPSLDTIKEKSIEKKHSHWLFLKSF
ncbi:unnamed protein product [Vicia faba]|uniref:Uncharacterized protein n=1 Tax=Vicia faba TaxID=3906 RepID=A0AAV0ZZ68_VICFA|nr:unnamed protein product [Vicia faba]